MERTLLVFALESEHKDIGKELGLEVLITGVGKVNAAMRLMRALRDAHTQNKPYTRVINLGSAGSPTFPHGTLAAAVRFVQRDMDATGLGFTHGETPFDDDACKSALTVSPFFSGIKEGTCASGDSFLQGPCPIACDLIDMEAYALAKVCQLENVPFACAKYVTDGADGSAHEDWARNLEHAAAAFKQLLKKML